MPSTEPATLQFSSEISNTTAECVSVFTTFPTRPSGVTTAEALSTSMPSPDPLSMTTVLHQFDGLRPMTRAGMSVKGELSR